MLFVKHFKRAANAGLNITVHAGEADGPDSIWDAINLLGAKRIGHGVAALQDRQLMNYMRDNEIGIESCLTSNYQTATVVHTANHPLKDFVRHGISVSLNTDDPGVSNITLEHEYRLAKEQVGLSYEQLCMLQMNGVNQAFMSTKERASLLSIKASN